MRRSPNRAERPTTTGRTMKRPSRIAASETNTAGADTPELRRYTMKNAPPPLSAIEWMP